MSITRVQRTRWLVVDPRSMAAFVPQNGTAQPAVGWLVAPVGIGCKLGESIEVKPAKFVGVGLGGPIGAAPVEAWDGAVGLC